MKTTQGTMSESKSVNKALLDSFNIFEARYYCGYKGTCPWCFNKVEFTRKCYTILVCDICTGRSSFFKSRTELCECGCGDDQNIYTLEKHYGTK